MAGAFLFPALCRVAFSAPLYGVFLSWYILSFPFTFLSVHAPCGVRAVISAHSAGCMALSAALYRTFAPLGYAHSRPILQPVPGLRCAAPLRPWAGCTLAPTAPEGATPQAVPVSGRKTPPISISGTGGEFLPEPVAKSLGVKSRPRQPFSRSAGLNYSRSSSADNSAIFLLVDSFFALQQSRKSMRLIRPFRRQL